MVLTKVKIKKRNMKTKRRKRVNKAKGKEKYVKEKIKLIEQISQKQDPPLPPELIHEIASKFAMPIIKDYERRHKSFRLAAKEREKLIFMTQLDMLEQDDGLYNPNNEAVANTINKAYRIFSSRDLETYPGLKGFAIMIFNGLRFMRNYNGENTREYEKTKKFFIKFLNNVFDKNIDESISDEDLTSDQILFSLYEI